MVPIDSKHDRPWSSANATLVALDIRKKAEVDLLRLDEHRSGGRLNAENGYSTLVLKKGTPGSVQGATYTADPVLAELKHSGVDTDDLAAKRYAEFCAEPRDEEATIAELGLNKAENAIGVMKARGAALDKEIAALGEPKKAKVPRRRIPSAARSA